MYCSMHTTINGLISSLKYWYEYHFNSSESWTLHYGNCVFMIYYNSGFEIGIRGSNIAVPITELSESTIKFECDSMIVGLVHDQ